MMVSLPASLYTSLPAAAFGYALHHAGSDIQDGCKTSCGQKTHPYRDINIITSAVRATMPLCLAANETYN